MVKMNMGIDINQSSLFPKQNVNKRNKMLSSIDEADISNLYKKIVLKMHYNIQSL